QKHVLAAREALMALGGEGGIEQGEHLQVRGDMPEGRHIAEGGHHGLLGLAAGLGGDDQVLDAAEIDGADDFGFAVDALTVAGVVIGVGVDEFGGEAWHRLGHTTRRCRMSSLKSKRYTKYGSGAINLHNRGNPARAWAVRGPCAERPARQISRSYKCLRQLKEKGNRPTS